MSGRAKRFRQRSCHRREFARLDEPARGRQHEAWRWARAAPCRLAQSWRSVRSNPRVLGRRRLRDGGLEARARARRVAPPSRRPRPRRSACPSIRVQSTRDASASRRRRSAVAQRQTTRRRRGRPAKSACPSTSCGASRRARQRDGTARRPRVRPVSQARPRASPSLGTAGRGSSRAPALGLPARSQRPCASAVDRARAVRVWPSDQKSVWRYSRARQQPGRTRGLRSG